MFEPQRGCTKNWHQYKRISKRNSMGFRLFMFTLKCCVFDGCTLEVTWAKPPEAQKQRALTDKRDSVNNLYKQLNYDTLDHNFDLSLSPNSPVIPGFPIISRANMKSRFPLHNIPNFKNSFTITRPIQLLNYICLENGWGEPVFNVSCVESDPSELFFVCSILIPGFPPLARKFMSDRVCRSPDEAKYYAACYVLKKLSITDIDGPPFPSSLTNPNGISNFPKNYVNNSSLSTSKPVNNLGFCSPSKNFPVQSFNKIQDQLSSFFNERGQGDASFLTPSQSVDNTSFDDIENCAPLLDPNTPIEPNSFLGLLASVAAASNVDLPLFNKPKL